MDSKESTARTTGALIHPEEADWMDFLYGEVAPTRKRELLAHLKECHVCSGNVDQWRESMQALDQFQLPPPPRAGRSWIPALRLAAAAVFVLVIGFAIGRRSSPSAEIADLRNSVAQLALMVQTQGTTSYSNSLFAATTAANEETLRLLGDYSRAQDEKLIADRQALAVALQTFEARLAQVRSELETVAVNTQTGFQETHHNMSQLVSYFPGTFPSNPNQK